MYINTFVVVDNQGCYCHSRTLKTNTKMTMDDAVRTARESGYPWVISANIRLASVLDSDMSVTKRVQSETVKFSIEEVLDIHVPAGEYYEDTTIRQLIAHEAIERTSGAPLSSVSLSLPSGNIVIDVEWAV